ncbi:MAG: hypothetical protein OHK0023_05550 [Anaerolineae bacterium]
MKTPRKVSDSISRILLVSLILLSLTVTPLPKANAIFDPLTLGALAGLAEVVGGKVNSVAATLGAEVAEAAAAVSREVNSVIETAKAAYADALNTTIDSFDAFTSRKLLDIQDLLYTLNDLLERNIALVRDTLIEVITTASAELRGAAADLQSRLQSLIVVGGETAVYVIDRTLFNVVQLVALILLGIGVLIFVGLLFREKRPKGLALALAVLLMFAFVAVFGAFALVPSVRAAALSATGLGIETQFEAAKAAKPEVFLASPSIIIRGETRSITLQGIHLRELGEPRIVIGTQSLPINASDDRTIVVNTSDLTLPDGEHTLSVRYGDDEGARLVVQVRSPAPTPEPPADLSIRSFSLNPSSPVRGRSTTATIVVQNTGRTAAGRFRVQWEAIAGTTASSSEMVVDSLAPGASRTVTLTYTYPNAGSFDTRARVDAGNTVTEANESNNISNLSIRVVLRRAEVTVVFDRFVVAHDANGFGGTNVGMNFDVNGESAYREFNNINDDQNNSDLTRNFNRPIALTIQRQLNENETLTICADGRRWHGTYSGPTGRVCLENLTSRNEWSAGGLRNSPENDYGRYDIRWYFSYRISVRWLN